MINKKHKVILFIFMCLFFNKIKGQSEGNISQLSNNISDSIVLAQIVTDTLFNSNQIITLLSLKNKSDKYHFKFAYSETMLKPTSLLAKKNMAIAAINGGFFDMDNGGSVTYFEVNDTVISSNKSIEIKWSKPNYVINGAIVITYENGLDIELANSEKFYELSKNEAAVLVAGPLLLLNSKKTELPDTDLVKYRHPRTCLCTTDDSVVFIAIDGRRHNAEGMNLYEVQDFLKNINCIDAINLDGGGSTTMWTEDKLIVNFPSDKSGERPISNALLILKQKNAPQSHH